VHGASMTQGERGKERRLTKGIMGRADGLEEEGGRQEEDERGDVVASARGRRW
jgi:hypothetical protein